MMEYHITTNYSLFPIFSMIGLNWEDGVRKARTRQVMRVLKHRSSRRNRQDLRVVMPCLPRRRLRRQRKRQRGTEAYGGGSPNERRSSRRPVLQAPAPPRGQNLRQRRWLRWKRIGVRLARKDIEPSERLGRRRWVIERTVAWLSG
jgi:hypothetical protein